MSERGPLARPGLAWLAGFVIATLFALLVATQNYLVLSRAGRAMPWAPLAVGELPVWYTWLALIPVVRRLVVRFPPLARPLGRNLVIHLTAALVGIMVMILVTTIVRWRIGGMIPPGMSFLNAVRAGYLRSFVAFIPIYAVLAAGVLAWNYYRDTQERAVKESRLEAALASARLESLRDQLHPHFLFNTLHAISALMAEDVGGARRMMRRLSELLRLSLEEGTHEVTLEEELRILDLYVEIQKIRFGDRLSVDYAIEPEVRQMFVPRMLLQPLVENAIKYSTSGQQPRGRVSIAAEGWNGDLRLRVRDNGPGFKEDRTSRNGGIGLSNTRARLEQLYGVDYAVDLINTAEGGALVEIRVPARATPRLEPEE